MHNIFKRLQILIISLLRHIPNISTHVNPKRVDKEPLQVDDSLLEATY
jgi:hypothetical protein